MLQAGEILVRTCCTVPPPEGTATNPTFAFVNGSHCLFSNGGPQVFIFSTASSDPPHEWILEMSIPINSDSNNPIMIVTATIPDSRLYVDALFAEVCDPATIKHTRSSTSTDSSVATFKWLRFALSDQKQDADSAVITFKDAKVSTIASFESRAFPLYAAIVEKNILFVSEARPELTEDADLGMRREDEAGNQMEEEEEHHGLGYDNLGYRWTQSESDVTVTLTLPENVTKKDLECEIESDEVVLGLTDGTTYLRGKLHAPIDPEASAWTLEKNV